MEEKRVDLEGILYNQDGTFKPVTGNHGNVSEKLAHLRNTYMESEREYFEYLLAIDSIRIEFESLLNEHANNLFECAMQIQEKLETGELETSEEKARMETMSPEEREAFHMQKLERAEGLMCLLYAAAKDKVKILELGGITPNNYSRSR